MSHQRRILALWLPRLPTDRLQRRRGASSEVPLAISARAGNALHVHALDAAAVRQGLHKGQPLANAQAMVQHLRVVPADAKADATLLEAIADWCDRFTPLVTLDAPDGLLLDITGAAHLFGGEAAMLQQIGQQLNAQGFAVQSAIAGNALAAHALARYGAGTLVPPGEDAAAIAPLPIAALECDAKALRALTHAGLRSIGQVAARGASELSERLGASFWTRLQRMRGVLDQPLEPRRPLPDLMAQQRFADPVTAMAVIAATLEKLAQALCGLLERQGRGARILEAVFFRADGAVRRIHVKTGAPARDPGVMLRLLQQKLEALADPLDPGFGFDLVRLEAMLADATQPHAVSFDSRANAKAQLGFLIDRLAARFGEARVQRFVPQDTHIPEAAAIAVPAQDQDFAGVWRRKRQAGDPPLRPLRLLEKPEEITAMAGLPDDPPKRFRWRRAHFAVIRAEGPERIAMEWWRHTGLARDYFRVETEDGQRFWLYRDGLYRQDGLRPRWYLQGVFS